VNELLKPVVYLVASIYFLVDAIFMAVAKPLIKWLSRHWAWKNLRAWIVSLRPYPTLLLFAVPVVLLEPVKPVAAYLAGSGRVATGIIVLIIGELLKLVLVERLFSLTSDKLMSIPAFAWAYGKYKGAKDWVTSSTAWLLVQRWSRIARYAVHAYVSELKASGRPRLAGSRSR
jgi:hypothetical protein